MAVLYRKYRPTRLKDVVGQEQVTSVLANAIKSGKIAHAFLFIGPRGTGKTSVARILAHAVNGFDYAVEDSYLDIIEIDAASNTGVDNIRELREKAIIAPTKGKYKVYIIDEVHMLTKSASNALLKTLEEPPEHVIFIMATTDAHKVPITISSRTQVHTFKLARPEIMLEHLKSIAKEEGIKITDEALEIVVRRGGGSFRDSLSLLDQIAAISDQEITAESLNHALGLPQTETIQNLLKSYENHDKSQINLLLKDLLNAGIRPEVLVAELIETIITEPRAQFLPLLAKLPNVAPPFPEAKLLLAFLSDGPDITERTSANVSQKTNMSQKTNLSQETHTPPESPIPEASKSPEPAKNAPSRALESARTSRENLEPSYPDPTPNGLKSTKNNVSQPSSPEKPQKQTPETPPKTSNPSKEFAWDTFLERIQDLNLAIYSQLRKVEYEFDGKTLHLYPHQKFTKNILEKANNTQILLSQLNGPELIIHEVGSRKLPEDGTISQISAIMGDVQEVKGDLPF